MSRRLRAILAGLTVAAWAAAEAPSLAQAAGEGFSKAAPGLHVPAPNPKRASTLSGGGSSQGAADLRRAAAGPDFPPPADGLFVPRPNPRAARTSAAVLAPPAPIVEAEAQDDAVARLMPAPRPDRAKPQPPDIFEPPAKAPPAYAAPAATQIGLTPPKARPSQPPARSARGAARSTEGASGGRAALDALALIGIFGDVNRPRALIRLPSGKIARVSQGQSVGELTVTRITSEGVAVRSSAGQRILRMP